MITGNVLQVNGAAALSYGALNLGGGANYVTGTLPSNNQAAQTMSGSVQGTTSSSIVVQIDGYNSTKEAMVTATSSNWNNKLYTKQIAVTTTTNASSTYIATLTVSDNALTSMDVIVQGVSTTSNDTFRQNFSLDFSRTSGGSIVAAANSLMPANTIGTGSAWTCTVTPSGGNVYFIVNASASLSVKWYVTAQIAIGAH